MSFTFKVFDEREAVAEGTHERYTIEKAKFLAKLKKSSPKGTL